MSAALVCSIALVACAGEGPRDAATARKKDPHPLVGVAAPHFSIESANGQGTISLQAMKGKVVIVDFWATWCDPCRKSFPKIQDLHVKYKAKGLEIVGVSEDDANVGIAEFAANYGAKFPVGWDAGKAIAGQWKPETMPASFIVDRNGIVRFAHLGYHDGDEAAVEQEVKSLL